MSWLERGHQQDIPITPGPRLYVKYRGAKPKKEKLTGYSYSSSLRRLQIQNAQELQRLQIIWGERQISVG
jgi:hypothetical protein